MLSKFQKIKSFSEDARRSRSILNGTVDLHVQAADHHRNIAGIGIRQHPVNVAGIRPPSPESCQPDSGDQSDRNPARPAGFRPSNRIWPEKAGFRPALAGRIWPDPATFAGIRLS
jgi:hypothetical protein